MEGESDTRQDDFERVAEDYLDACRRGEAPSIADLAAAHPELPRDALDVLPALAVLEGVDEPSPAEPTRRVDTTIGEHRLGRELGRGGMGVVYEARHATLDRTVALKVLTDSRGFGSGQRERFEREVRVVARLRHPNIVTVFDYGEEDGACFYTMPLLSGASLDRVLRALRAMHDGSATRGAAEDSLPEFALARRMLDTSGSSTGSAQAGAGELRSYFRAVAKIALDVGLALAHAHEAGVLHRDLKPSNLILDDDGHVWVTDFGLAKSEWSEDITRTGDVLGTPRYLAPESLHGISGPATDVYGLGVTLYELVTLQPAHAGRDPVDLLRSVAEDLPARVSRLERRVPEDLETIVMKAIEKDPARRYASAHAMSEDLRRFLANEPIAARPPSILHRTKLFARRHRTAVVAAALLLVVTATLLAGWIVSLRESRDDERAARMQSDENLRLARRAVEQIQVRLAIEDLPTEPRLQLLHREVLEDAVRFYEEFLARGPVDAGLRQEASDAWRALGRILFVLYDFSGAERSFNEAEPLLRALLGDPERGAEAEMALVTVLLYRGHLYEIHAAIEAADACYAEALERARDLDKAHGPRSLQASIAFLEAHERIGSHFLGTHRAADAMGVFENGVRRGQELLAEHPGSAGVRRMLLGVLLGRFEMHRLGGRLAEAQADLHDARDLADALLMDAGSSPEDGLVRARVDYFQGALERERGDFAQAITTYGLAASRLDALIRDYPLAEVYRTARAEVTVFQALARMGLGELTGALTELRAGLEELEQLLETKAPTFVRRAELATPWLLIGNAERFRGESGAAADAYRRAIAILEELRASTPRFSELSRPVSLLALARGNLGALLTSNDSSGVKPDLEGGIVQLTQSLEMYEVQRAREPNGIHHFDMTLLFYEQLGSALRWANRIDEARATFEEGMELAEESLATFSNADELMFRSIGLSASYGNLLRSLGELEEARERLERAVELTEIRLDDGRPNAEAALASQLNNLGLVYLRAEQYEDAAECYGRAIDIREQILQDAPEDWFARRYLVFHMTGYANALAGLGEIDDAVAVGRESLELDALDPRSKVEVARVLALAARREGSGSATRSSELEAEALDLIEEAAAEGYASPLELRSHPWFEGLRDDPRFIAAVAAAERAASDR